MRTTELARNNHCRLLILIINQKRELHNAAIFIFYQGHCVPDMKTWEDHEGQKQLNSEVVFFDTQPNSGTVMHEAQINNDVIASEAWPENELTNSTTTYCGEEYSKPDRKDIRIRPISKVYRKNSKEQTKECRDWCQNRIWHDGNKKIRCLHKPGGKDPCRISSNQYLIDFGVIRISASQIPEFHETCLLSIVAAIMSSVYSIIGCSLAIYQVAANGTVKDTVTGGAAGVLCTNG